MATKIQETKHPSILLDDVWLEYPIYSINARSLRGHLARFAGRSLIRQHDSQVYVIQALQAISLKITPGDRIGLVGRNGSGKTTLLKLLAGIYEPTSGRVARQGTIGTLLNIAFGLDDDQTGLYNITVGGMLLGKTRREMEALAAEIADFTELGPYLALPLRTYSSGMRMRLAFAIATSVRPQILLIDEVMGAGDAQFAAKAQRRIRDLAARVEILVFATHSQGLMESFCNKAVLMREGRIEFFGPVAEAFAAYNRGAAATRVATVAGA